VRAETAQEADKITKTTLLKMAAFVGLAVGSEPVSVSYSQQEKLGEGSFGKVWKVFTPSGAPYSKKEHPTVAMKVVENPDEDAWIEVELLKKINHNNIVKYLTSFKSTDGSLCIIMEYCDGGTFTKMIKTFKRAEWNIWRSLRDVAQALVYLHGRKILHRDLKPDNILAKFIQYDPDGIPEYTLKLCDFGVAKLLNQKAQDMYYCTTAVGTPTYMAPEALQGGGERYTTSADIWSLGAFVSFHANRGKHLFATEHSAIRRRTGDYTLDPSKYSEDLIQLVDDMLDPHPSSRPTAAQVVEEARKGNRQGYDD